MYVWQKSYNDHLDNAICLCLHHTSREILNTMIVHATDPCADIYLLSKRQLEHNTGSRVKSPHSVTMVQKYSQVLGATKFSHTSSITQNQQQILIHMYWSEHEQYINRFFYKKHCLGSFIPRITPSVAQDHSFRRSSIFSRSSSAASAFFTRTNMAAGLFSSSLGLILGFGTHIIYTLFVPCLFRGIDGDRLIFNKIFPEIKLLRTFISKL